MSGKQGKTCCRRDAICEGGTASNMRFVSLDRDQQSRLLVHRARRGFVEHAPNHHRIRG